MGNGDNRSLILLQVLLQPVYALGIKVVGRLVEEKHVGLLKEKLAQGHTAALATREVGYRPVTGRTVECCHGTVELRVHIPRIGGVYNILHLSLASHELVHLVRVAIILLQAELHVYILVFRQGVIYALHSLHDILLDGLRLVERWVLWQIAHAIARTPYHLTLRGLFQSGDNLHKR